MSSLPEKCVIDTNVPIIANMAKDPDSIPIDLEKCVSSCIETIQHVVRNGGLVIDCGDEIYDEYRHKLSMSGQPGVGDAFMRWVHYHRWTFPEDDRVFITKKGYSFAEFPNHPGLTNFDLSDHKFVAVANAHPPKPPILQATDSKWWGWKDALAEVGITVRFVCPRYIETKYKEKMG